LVANPAVPPSQFVNVQPPPRPRRPRKRASPVPIRDPTPSKIHTGNPPETQSVVFQNSGAADTVSQPVRLPSRFGRIPRGRTRRICRWPGRHGGGWRRSKPIALALPRSRACLVPGPPAVGATADWRSRTSAAPDQNTVRLPQFVICPQAAIRVVRADVGLPLEDDDARGAPARRRRSRRVIPRPGAARRAQVRLTNWPVRSARPAHVVQGNWPGAVSVDLRSHGSRRFP